MADKRQNPEKRNPYFIGLFSQSSIIIESFDPTDPMTSVSTLKKKALLATQVKFTDISPKPDIAPLNPKLLNYRPLNSRE